MDTTSDFHIKYLDQAKKWYKEQGFQEKSINILNLKTESIPRFDDFDVLHMWGENTFHYLHRIREIGLDHKIREFIDRGGVYVGTSAGSSIMCPDVDEKLTTDVNDIGLKNVNGLGYVDFNLIFHWDTMGGEVRKDQIQYSWESGKRVIPLTDQQAILVYDNDFKIISPDYDIP